ncbi:glycoside hydrolase [Virgibacillus profundi]|uniref:Glycoside hydrolase n=1 Tax=Virgibacillus profundi TaxID=2024555 RepID=A0A2A2IKQ1_9BACI|nr:beta-galactosidase [Virgibacillus profundi]PAV31673.1 glycoside hydrolase [Virgibacillus profundi]PXY55406.1 glycoside hydrolase [Virgibacillus profundi]
MNKIVLFYDSGFPIDGDRPDVSFFENFGDDLTVVDAVSLNDALRNKEVDCLINLHGPYFPKNAWQAIYQHMENGKGFLHIGGSPFRIPCNFIDGEWKKEREQTAYHQELNIHETLPVKSKPIVSLEHNEDIPLFSEKEELFTIEDTYNFILHVTKSSTIEAEMGSVGPMDARIYPLLKGISKTGRQVAAPVVLIENVKGKFTGGRWLFINQKITEQFWTAGGARAINEFATFTANGVTEMSLKTNYATYEDGERANVSFQIQAFREQLIPWSLTYSITKDGEQVYSKVEEIEVSNKFQIKSFVIPVDIKPGYYEVSCVAKSANGEKRTLHQGFWGMDRDLLNEGEPLSNDRDYFQKDGRPFPIVGMTYMTSDVARYYLFLPNPSVWDRDMAQMKRAGINYIRTGIWTAWRHMMFVDGHVDENVLRSVDAFILCAKKHDLEVTFNFFSFTPETWEGENPYLDPRSVEAQKRFITAFVSRHTKTTNINWDLINEPSMFDPSRTFAGPRSLHDSFDRKAYREWLEKRHGSIAELQEKWNMTERELPSFAVVEPPEASEINFGIRDMLSGKKGLKWIDYALYTMDMHNKWAKELTDTIKQLAPNQLVTVGQDEALAGQRPSPLFYSEAVDYTTNHTWWLMDQLVWDGIFTKDPAKPNLVQETGIMYVENPNNQAKRSEEELRNILERKYAYSFSTGGAGAVQWLWNTNYFMNNINESNIGAIRADGTEKPETDVSYDFGAFINKTRDLFKNRKLEDIAVVFPYSNDFSNRKLAQEATSKLTRTLAYEMNIPFRALSEYQLDSLKSDLPKLVVVPSPHNFSDNALNSILAAVKEQGITLLFTGPVNLDAYWNRTERMEKVIGSTHIENIVREELLEVNGRHYPLSFGGERIADAMREMLAAEPKTTAVKEYSYGKGEIIWSPLPVELNERSEPIIALYEHALKKANISAELDWLEGDFPGVYGRKLSFENGSLYIFVSEFAEDTPITFRDSITEKSYSFILATERTVMFSTDETGKITNVYRPEEVAIKG